MTRVHIKAKCMAWLDEIWEDAPEGERKFFLDHSEEDLLSYHNNLCMDMRNNMNLWTLQDVIGDPDDFSMEVLILFREEKLGI